MEKKNIILKILFQKDILDVIKKEKKLNDKLGDRMKSYENISRIYLTRRLPLMIRIDGKAFHTWTRGLKKPYDDIMRICMTETAKYLGENIQGCKLIYIQSDEISLLLTDYDDIKTDAWFGKNLQKTVSISAALATLAFNRAFREYLKTLPDGYSLPEEDVKHRKMLATKLDTAIFDSRAFVLPKEEVVNYFIWRQNDATRNAIQGLGQSNFSHKEIQNVNTSVMQEKLFSEKGINFDKEPTWFKRGWCVEKQGIMITAPNGLGVTRQLWTDNLEIPIFTQDREYITRFV
jgi:tRNA(His) 5'-end guanylyltransferase